MSVGFKEIYLNTVKVILTKENFKKFKKYLEANEKEQEDLLELVIRKYHQFKRNKKRTNEWFEQFISTGNRLIEEIDRAIELHKEAIKHLKKIRKKVRER